MSLSKTDQAAIGRQGVDELLERFQNHTATIGILGLGYVGLPLALTAVGAGFTVLGFDNDASRVERLNRGDHLIAHLPATAVLEAVSSKTLVATADFARLSEPDALFIAVPTPLSVHREPDLSFVVSTVKAIAATLRKGQLVVLESTTYPGTLREVVQPILEATGLKAGVDFYLGYSPEREDPGNASFETRTIPKVVGADDPVSLRLTDALYTQLVVKTVPVSSSATAEAVKITENVFRAVNIALVNELKVVYEAMGVDLWEVIEAAKTKPFGFMPFYPGPGLGGHCIPIDPFYLTWKARAFGISTRFVELAGEINAAMPAHVVERVAQALDARQGRGLSKSRILLIGIAYKKNIDDMRESPSLRLIDLLEARGACVDYHDPHIARILPTRHHPALTGRVSLPLSDDMIASYSCVLIATDHDSVEYALIADHAQLIVDTRNACESRGLRPTTLVKA